MVFKKDCVFFVFWSGGFIGETKGKDTSNWFFVGAVVNLKLF